MQNAIKAFITLGLALLFAFSCLSASATLTEIKVAGLTPGKSTRKDVEALRVGNPYVSRYLIGGYRLDCAIEYSKDVLQRLDCIIGTDYDVVGTKVRSVYDQTLGMHVTPEEAYEALENAYVKKFGPPFLYERNAFEKGDFTALSQRFALWVSNNVILHLTFSIKSNEGALHLDLVPPKDSQQTKDTAAQQLKDMRNF